MTTKVFITGATGYIGGDALWLIVKKHPDWEITCLVRNSEKGAQVAAQYASVRLVYGDLGSVDLIEEEASKADIIYHFADCDDEPSANAITRGLARRSASNTGFWIHTSGTLILAFETFQKGLFGGRTSKVFNDWDGISDLTSMPDKAPHRNVDKIVLNASVAHPNIKTAIVCPPCIYGVGRGPGNQRSKQIYRAAQIFLSRQQALQINQGENIWHQVHVYDLSELYVLLGEAAVAGGSPATWNNEGYYFAENGEFVWGEMLGEVAKVAHKQGLLPSDQLQSISVAEILKDPGLEGAHIGVGTTSRGVSLRARNLLGWKPKERSLKDEIPDVVEAEAKRLGLIKGHREQLENAET